MDGKDVSFVAVGNHGDLHLFAHGQGAVGDVYGMITVPLHGERTHFIAVGDAFQAVQRAVLIDK